MKFHDLRSFVTELEAAGELVRVSAELSPRYEIAAAIKAIAQKQGKAVLCDNVTGYHVPIVGNLLGSTRRLAMALDVAEKDLSAAYLQGRNNPIKPMVLARGPVQEVVENGAIDILRTMPVLTHHQKDAGPYLSSAFVVGKDPVTGVRGLGIHRVQIKSRDTVGISLASPPLSDFLARAEERDKPLPIAIVLGADPLTYFASPQIVPGGDKYELAGGLAKSPIELVKCQSVDVEVPAYAEFVLEGNIIPHQRETEGPFGESSGYYTTHQNPVARIKVITHRRNPIYHALVTFAGEEKVLQFPRFQIDTLDWLQSISPSVRQIHCPTSGVIYVQMEKQTDEEVATVIKALFGRSGAPYSKIVVAVDTDVDILNPEQIAWALATRVQPDRDVIIQSNLPGMAIDPSAAMGKEVSASYPLGARTAKLGIDATKPLAEPDRYEKIDMPLPVKSRVREVLGIEIV